jgi:hypothetical protein
MFSVRFRYCIVWIVYRLHYQPVGFYIIIIIIIITTTVVDTIITVITISIISIIIIVRALSYP